MCSTQPNNGMHPTADTLLLMHISGVGRRVMPALGPAGEVTMPFDNERFPQLIQALYRIVGELEAMFPGRPFTPDGHMVGSLAECFAEYYYDLKLFACSYPGHDAYTSDCKVEIKATQGNSVALRSGPDMLLVFKLSRDGSFEEIYNGPGAPVWALVESKPKPSNGQYKIGLAQLRKLMQNVPLEHRLQRRA